MKEQDVFRKKQIEGLLDSIVEESVNRIQGKESYLKSEEDTITRLDLVAIETTLELLLNEVREIKRYEEIINDARALCKKFITKVVNGEARSRETYAECKELLNKINS